jgi:preprotein translocase subunit SecB
VDLRPDVVADKDAPPDVHVVVAEEEEPSAEEKMEVDLRLDIVADKDAPSDVHVLVAEEEEPSAEEKMEVDLRLDVVADKDAPSDVHVVVAEEEEPSAEETMEVDLRLDVIADKDKAAPVNLNDNVVVIVTARMPTKHAYQFTYFRRRSTAASTSRCSSRGTCPRRLPCSVVRQRGDHVRAYHHRRP